MSLVCPNCNYTDTHDADFCSSCGQRFGPSKLTVGQFLKDLVDHVFALETTFFKTLSKIFIPGELTLEYFNGHRKKYYHPLRLYFILLVLHIGVLGGLIPYDKIFKEVTFKANQVLVKENIRKELDSKFSNLRDGASRKYKDSVYTWLAINEEARARDTISNMQFSAFNMKFSQQDLITLSVDSLAKKYQFQDKYFPKLITGQMKKFVTDPKGMILYILGNISWMMIIMLPTLALFMKFLFRWKTRYYIEHLFYLYHWHAASFLLGIILVFFFRNTIVDILPFFFPFVALFGFVAWHRYYQQGLFFTFFKFTVMGILYLVLFSFFIALTALISFSSY